MFAYFPFDTPTFAMTMGVRPLAPSKVIEIDPAEVQGEVRLKRDLLATDPTTYRMLPPATLAMQWDTLDFVLPALAMGYPQWFRLHRSGDRWRWHNHLTHEVHHFLFGDADTLPQAPLEWLGRQVQEDLVLLAPEPQRGFPLVAGVVCFPNMWGLTEKFGQPLAHIHQPVPGFAEHIGHSTQLLFERMKPQRPVWRLNWSILPLDRLNLAPQFFAENAQAAQRLTPTTIGERGMLRVERQTLTRLPATGAILFTIHTYQASLATVARDPVRRHQLAHYLSTVPMDILRYKGIDRFVKMLIDYVHDQYLVNDESAVTYHSHISFNIRIDI